MGNKIYKTLAMVGLGLMLAACAPSQPLIQTAIAQTQAAAPSSTATEMADQYRIQTAVAETLAPIAETSTQSGLRLQTAVVQTLTAIVPPTPTQSPTPLVSPTPLTPTATITPTHKPWPTITNTVEPIIPSGPITLTGVGDMGNSKAQLTWQAEGSFPNGLYVVWSANNPNPAYPDDYWWYFANGHLRSGTVDVKQPKTYYFRVCELTNDGKRCVNYSNAIRFTIK